MARSLAAALLLIVAARARAQQPVRVIDPGMSRARVTAALGAPATARTVGEFAYLFYRNSCGRRCGMNDLVVLRRDSVVDAIFRSPVRRYTGTSSSPAPVSAADARRLRPTAPSDARPSLRTSPDAVRPAPSAPAKPE